MSREELQEARRKLGLSQVALGAAIGVSASQVYSMEAGRRDIGLTVKLAVRYKLIEAGHCTRQQLELNLIKNALRSIAEPEHFSVLALSGAAESFRNIAADALRKLRT